jgi:hypothetical protein
MPMKDDQLCRKLHALTMFIGLFKYYRQSYLDLLDLTAFSPIEKSWCMNWRQSGFRPPTTDTIQSTPILMRVSWGLIHLPP